MNDFLHADATTYVLAKAENRAYKKMVYIWAVSMPVVFLLSFYLGQVYEYKQNIESIGKAVQEIK